MRLEIEINFIPAVKQQKLITTEFKKSLLEVLEKHFKLNWHSVSYCQVDD